MRIGISLAGAFELFENANRCTLASGGERLAPAEYGRTGRQFGAGNRMGPGW
jgi:hypothetical protein